MGPQILSDLCEGCGNCVEVCPVDVFSLKDEKVQVVKAEVCLECGTCVEECPTEAIKLDE